MNLAYERRRAADLARAVALWRRLRDRERWPREQLARFQQEQLDSLVRHAVAHSPYYRERIGTADGPFGLSRLPALDKATMMDRFDDLVCDRRLRRDELLAHVEELTEDTYYRGRYRVVTTSGSSGRKGVYVFDRPEWSAYVAQYLRYVAFLGAAPRVPRQRLALLGGAGPSHVTRRVAQTVDLGLHKLLSLPVTMAVPELVKRLNAFQPQVMNVYPSVAGLLAEEQLARRLRISPEAMSTSSELRTPQMTARIEEAFGIRPFNLYATTEGMFSVDCDRHDGLHLFEDMTIVENVDEDGRPVADGERGAKLLITNLANRIQPLIRYELADSVTIDAEPCGCEPHPAPRAHHRRAQRRRHPPAGADASFVAIHPMQFAVVAHDREVLEFQVVQEGPLVQVIVVARGEAREMEARLAGAVGQRLRELGVTDPQVVVERRPSLARQDGGKLQIVVADRAVLVGQRAP